MPHVTRIRRHDRARASLFVAAPAAVGLLLVLAALPSRLEGQCTLAAPPVSFEPNPPGVSRPGTLSSGFNNGLLLFQPGGSGPYRLLMSESFGYSVLDLTTPTNPTALAYHDIRFPLLGINSVKQAGDGQSLVQTIAVSPDGQRAAFSMTGLSATIQTAVGDPGGGGGFTLWGDFYPKRSNSTLVQHVGSRYIAYDIHPNLVSASDVTTLPGGSLTANNLPFEVTAWPGGGFAVLAGNYILYQTSGTVRVIDASSPGPIGSIATNYPQTTITSADFPGGRSIANYTAAVDPADATKLWVLVELNANALAGENSPSYGLLFVTKSGLAKTSAGPIWRVPSQAGDVWLPAGMSSALIPNGTDLFVLMWAESQQPTLQFLLYSTTVGAWGSAAPSSFPVSGATFALPSRTAGFGVAGTSSVYMYVPTTVSAYVIPMSCVSVNAPAVASLIVTNQAGAALNSGDTVFLGDQITITPSINPPPSTQPLTPFGWNFDLDFHAGAVTEDFGPTASPRLHAPDTTLGAFGLSQQAPLPATIVGPCDPQVGGVTVSTGAGCWNSVTTNGAFAGGTADFTTTPAAGSTKALTFAFEAHNALGSAGPRLFTLNWQVPAAKLQATQILSGLPLTSASDGHPTANGFKWYFGATPTSLTQATGCAGPTCVPPASFDTTGTYSYWLTATYANGYATPDCPGAPASCTAAMGTYTITDYAPAFAVNGSATGPITGVISQNLSVTNSSQRGQTVTAAGGFYYSLCQIPCAADNYVLWGTMGDASPSGSPPTSATIPIPGTAGTYALKIRVNYTNPTGQAFWPDPAGAGFFTLNVVAVTPLNVTASVNPASAAVNQSVTFSCNASGGLTPYSYQWRNPISFVIPGANGPTYTTTSTVAGGVTAYCFVTDSQAPVPAQSSASATATFTGGGGPPPGGNLSVFVSASPNPGTVGQNVTFSCGASGGTPPYSYVWRSPATSAFQIPGATSAAYTTSSSVVGSLSAGCTVTDNAGAQSSNSATVAINAPAGPPAVCVDANFTVLDRGAGFAQIPLSSGILGQYFAVETGQKLALVASGTGMASADWTFGDGGTGSGNPVWYSYATAGTFTTTLTVNSNAACKKSYKFIVAGPSGLFTAYYADSSQFTSTQVQSGKDLTFLATDSADSYAWDFGDGSTATGKSVTHAFRVNGSSNVTFTTTLTVTIGSQNWTTSQNFTVLPPPEPPKWFVAGMAYLQGSLPGTLFQTDVTLFNPDTTRPGTYSLAFLDGKTPVDPANLTWKTINLGAQESISSPNILAFFGQPLGSYGALLVRGDSAPVPPVLTARTFNSGDPTKGTFGLSVPSTQPSSGLTPQAALAQQFLIGLRDDDSAYTNIGLMNVTTDWSHARLEFTDRSGATSYGKVNVDVPPYGVAQLSRPLAAAPPNGVGFPSPLDVFSVKVSVLTGGAVFPYATVIDRRSTDSIVVTAFDRPSSTSRTPGIIRLQGANNTVWRSRFYITNPSTTSRKASVTYSFIPCDATGSCRGRVTGLQADVTFLPGETLWADDFPKVWLAGFGFDVSDTTSYASSYVDVSPAAGDPNQEPLLVLGQTYNDQPNGPVGLQVPGFTAADAASKDGAYKRLLLAGLVSNASYRTNVAVFLQSGTSGRCTLHVLSEGGIELARQDVGFGGTNTFIQINDSALFGSISGSKDRLTIVIDSFDGSPISAYATIVDNVSGDATFLKAQPAP